MSKVINIKEKIIPCLNKLFDNTLKNISNSWYLDNKQSLYKLLIFEDGYLISSDTEYPEELENFPSNNKFTNIKIYLEKVTRTNFVSDKESIFKFTFSLNNSVYHYIFKELLNEVDIFNSTQINSRKRKSRILMMIGVQSRRKK